MTEAGVPVRTRAVSVYLVRHTGDAAQVLLMRRTGTLAGAWFSVAGRIESGEMAWQAALREVREETGLVPDALYSADIIDQFYVAEHNVINLLPVFLGFVAPDARVEMNEEHDALAWLSFEDACERVDLATQRRVLNHIRAEFIDRAPSEHLRIVLPGG